MDHAVCSKCKEKNNPTFSQCWKCGQSFVTVIVADSLDEKKSDIATGESSSGSHPKKCPFCAEEILEDAKKCKHCGEWLNQKQKRKFDCEIIDQNGKKMNRWFESYDQGSVEKHIQSQGWQIVSIKVSSEGSADKKGGSVLGFFIAFVGYGWATLGVANIVMGITNSVKAGTENLGIWILLFNMILFIIPGLVCGALGTLMAKKKGRKN